MIFSQLMLEKIVDFLVLQVVCYKMVYRSKAVLQLVRMISKVKDSKLVREAWINEKNF